MAIEQSKMDFYLKGLSTETRIKIYNALKDNEDLIGLKTFEDPETIEMLTSAGGDMEAHKKAFVEELQKINLMLREFSRTGVFDTEDKSLQELAAIYNDVLKPRDEEELREFFGCSYEEYKPEVCKRKGIEKEGI